MITDETYPSTIGSIFLRSVKVHGHRTALVSKQGKWTYLEFAKLVWAGIEIIKLYLSASNCRMAIVGNNHAAYLIGYFASQCFGRPTVEIGALERLDRQIEIIEKTKSTFVLTDNPMLEQAISERLTVLSFDAFLSACQEIAAERESLFDGIIAQKDSSLEASIIYTSGTTGTPKGVILTQRNFKFIIETVANYLELACKDRFALILPLYHTYGKTMVLACMAIGAAVVLLDNFTNPHEFLSALSEHKCTILSAVPYHIHVILKWCNLSKYDLSELRIMTFSANKLPVKTIDRIKEALPKTEIFSMYGLTESTTRASFVPPHLLFEKKESCGKPLHGVELKIIDEQGHSLKQLEVGEVLIKGPNVMAGYFDDAKLTSETLQNGWLKTGDIGYLDEDGFLFLRGRKKEIIKCAGERISPIEIEEIILQHPGVSDCAVVAAPDPMLGEVPHAFIVSQDGFCQEGELRVFCAQRLSHHKLPRYFTFTDTLPMTGSGKVKKHLLLKGE